MSLMMAWKKAETCSCS